MNLSLRKLRPWPRTLSMQLILVMALSVIFSNVAVAYYFEYTNERQFDDFNIERLSGQTARLVNSLSGIPDDLPEVRCTITRYASQGSGQSNFRFNIRSGAVPVVAMNDEDKHLASRVASNLRPELAKNVVTVHQATVNFFADRRGANNGKNDPCFNPRFAGGPPPGGGRGGNGGGGRGNGGGRGGNDNNNPLMVQVVDVAVQIDKDSYLMARSTRFPDGDPRWPMENRIAMLLSILVTSAGAAMISRRMSKPLEKLTDAASEVAKGGAAPRVPEEGPDDVRRAAVAFNAMTDQVQRTMASQRQLLTAVGHDLRTPITAMRLSMEFLEEGETRESLEKNLTELQTLTEAVLSAAKGAGGEAKRNVDLAVLLDSLCADLEELGEPVSWESRGPAPMFCRPNEVTRAARNLIENAIAYGKAARVRLDETKDAYEIVVDDDGPGIPATDRERVFEPFVRLETSRNLSTGGTGLGLTLVKAIAEGHGGSVILENREEGGLRVRLRLPRSMAKASS